MENVSNQPRSLSTAVLFLVFNRPETTRQVFEAIRQAKPTRLYVAADGPRASREGEAERCEKVRNIATAVDWPCELKTLFRQDNLGCKSAVSSGITWFFDHEEHGIILEDDCLPHPDFFKFCSTLLVRYAADTRVWAITGDNFQNGVQRGDGSYYFSRYNHVWGWASWRRAWRKADMGIRFWPVWKYSSAWKRFWPDSVARLYWGRIFDRMYRAEIDSWAYPWTASVWFHGGLTATPNVNLVSNIGFGEDSTHTTSANSPLSNMVTAELCEIHHPTAVSWDSEADQYVFEHTFGGRNMRFPRIFIVYPRNIAARIISRSRKLSPGLVTGLAVIRKKSLFPLVGEVARRAKGISLIGAIKKRLVVLHKNMLSSEEERFSSYQDVIFVFQTFNKAANIERVLKPFLNLFPKNVILFADGCIDSTLKTAAKMLRGKNHLVINANDTHEIKNYKLGAVIGGEWACKYVVLLQDDDVYSGSVKGWLDLALKRFNEDPSLAIIGLNSGFHLTERPPVVADDGMTKALFTITENGGRTYHRLAHYQELASSCLSPSVTGEFFEYVAIVNRAPQIIRIKDILDLGLFPKAMMPYQYDDYYNCFQCWMNNRKVMHMPISTKTGNVGTGGMRLYNNVRVNSRPQHFARNFNYVLKHFGEHWASGRIQDAVARANDFRQG
jgi:hypothetical protein